MIIGAISDRFNYTNHHAIRFLIILQSLINFSLSNFGFQVKWQNQFLKNKYSINEIMKRGKKIDNIVDFPIFDKKIWYMPK